MGQKTENRNIRNLNNISSFKRKVAVHFLANSSQIGPNFYDCIQTRVNISCCNRCKYFCPIVILLLYICYYCILRQNSPVQRSRNKVYVCMYVCMYVDDQFEFRHFILSMYVCMYVCTSSCLFVCNLLLPKSKRVRLEFTWGKNACRSPQKFCVRGQAVSVDFFHLRLG